MQIKKILLYVGGVILGLFGIYFKGKTEGKSEAEGEQNEKILKIIKKKNDIVNNTDNDKLQYRD